MIPGSHYSIDLARCRHCNQAFAKVFHEFIDYAGGKDAMYWDVLPVTEREAKRLASAGGKALRRTFGR